MYPIYAVVAEKFHAMVALGVENSRMKDFYDLWAIARRFGLDGETLARSLAATFERRRTPLPAEAPIALTGDFADLSVKAAQWGAFARKNRLAVEGLTLAQVQAAIGAFVLPATAAAREGSAFQVFWKPGGPWEERA